MKKEEKDDGIEIIEPEEQKDDLQKKYDELEKKYLLTLAEFDNFRKRMFAESAKMRDDGARSVLEQFLPVIDNFERAVASSSKNADDPLYKGVEMILRQLQGALDYIGVSVIPAEGKPFDHNLHNAVAHVEDENFEQNVVVEEMQKGYKYKDKVLRPSTVKVAN